MPSAVWEHFERPEKGKDNPVCRHCDKSVKNKGGNISNLMARIKTKHFKVFMGQNTSQLKPEQANMLIFLAENL